MHAHSHLASCKDKEIHIGGDESPNDSESRRDLSFFLSLFTTPLSLSLSLPLSLSVTLSHYNYFRPEWQKMPATASFKIIKTVSEIKVQSVDLCVCVQHFKDSAQRAVWIYAKPHKPPPEVVEWWVFFTQTAPPPSVHNYHNTCSYMQISAAICLSSVQCFVCKPELRGQKKCFCFVFQTSAPSSEMRSPPLCRCQQREWHRCGSKKPENINPKLFVWLDYICIIWVKCKIKLRVVVKVFNELMNECQQSEETTPALFR